MRRRFNLCELIADKELSDRAHFRGALKFENCIIYDLSMSGLFDNVRNDFEGPQGHNEETYSFYNRSSRKEIQDARLQMEAWFNRYPEVEQADLRRTFKNDFDAGFFELFLFTLFSRMGYAVRVHPDVPNGGKTPDFLISGMGTEFYLEAKVSYYENERERATARRLATVYDVLDRSTILDFFIWLRKVEMKSTRQPQANKIRRDVELSTERYQADVLYAHMQQSQNWTPSWEVYQDDDVYIEFGLVPKSPSSRGTPAQRAIGVYGQEPKVLQNAASLKKALRMKASRYDILDKPYIIAVNDIDMMALDIDDVMDCLFGTTCVVPELMEQTGAVQEFRQHDGFFTGREDHGQHTRVSAAFITQVNPSNWRSALYWMFEHEKAQHPISLRTSPLVTRFIENATIYRTSGTSFGEIIG